jgi:hypothetical protein
MTGWRKFLLIVFLMFVAWMAAIGVLASILWVKDIFFQPAPIASERIKARMKYHGVQMAECVGDKCFFWRNGEWVRL